MNAVKKKKRRRRLKKSVKRALAIIAFSIIILASTPFLIKWIKSFKPKDVGVVRVDRYRDLNAVHLEYARIWGIPPIATDKEFKTELKKLIRGKRLAELKDSKYYQVDNLTHSHPYLTPEAVDLLDIIGKRFQKNLKKNGLGTYKFRVTSVLRTHESQNRLSRRNINAATTETSHLYGTSIDIGWKKIYKKTFWGGSHLVADGPAIKVLSETIGELRKEGRLVVVTEMKEACFHITLAKK